jgi:Leucine Rich repeat
LDLQGNKLKDEGLVAMIQPLFDTKTLLHFSLAFNEIEDILMDG